MKRNKLFIAAIAAAMTLIMAIPAFAATYSDVWKQDSAGNWYVEENGQKVKNAWFCDDAVAGNGQNVWYLLGPDGNMMTAGLLQDQSGNYYSLETNHNGYYGMLRYQSGNYDGVNLSLESSHNGSFAAIKNQDGIEALKAKYGVTKVPFGNETCRYSSQMTAKSSGANTPGADWESIRQTVINIGKKYSNIGDGGVYELSHDTIWLLPFANHQSVAATIQRPTAGNPGYYVKVGLCDSWSDMGKYCAVDTDQGTRNWYLNIENVHRDLIIALLGEADGNAFFNQYKAHADQYDMGGYTGEIYHGSDGAYHVAWRDAPCGNGVNGSTLDLSGWQNRIAPNGLRYSLKHDDDCIDIVFYN